MKKVGKNNNLTNLQVYSAISAVLLSNLEFLKFTEIRKGDPLNPQRSLFAITI